MYHFHADDGRILTPPIKLEPKLKGAFPAFSKLLGHVRFNYVADEIWDGKSSLVFSAGSEQMASITLEKKAFCVHIADEHFRLVDETLLETVFEALKKAPPGCHRPFEQRTIDGCPCGRRCDLCLGGKKENFCYMDWICYNKVLRNTKRGDGEFDCPGCEAIRTTKGCYGDENWNGCKYYICLTEKGYANCVECGEYHACDAFRDDIYAGLCNIGVTAEEVTKLVIPYCMIERLDTYRNSKEHVKG